MAAAGGDVNTLSLAQVLADSKHRLYFRQFLIEEFSLDNLLFYESVQQYRELDDTKERLKRAKGIYEEFISSGSPNEVNVTYETRRNIEARFEDSPDQQLFDKACADIFELMNISFRDRYMKSRHYQNYLDSPDDSAGGGCCTIA